MNLNLADIIKNINPYWQSIELVGNCKITNCKIPSAIIKNPFTIIQKDGNVSVDGLAQQEFKDIESSLSIFSKIATMDGNSSNLTAEDLKLAREDYNKNRSVWKELGVSFFRYDPDEDMANIKIGNQTLSIDFDKAKTKIQKAEAKESKPIEQKQDNKVSDKKTTTDTKKTNSSNTPTKTQQVAKSVEIPDKYAGVKKNWIPHIKATAKKYGYSEELIISIALSEGFTQKSTYKNEGGGLYEVGFGHTTRANHNNKFGKNFKIDMKTAFDWLGQDIKDKEAKIKQFGSFYNYNNLPKPLKEMMIDVAFNRGEGKLNPNLKLTEEEKKKGKRQIYDDNYDHAIANIENKSWGSAAVRFRQEKFPKYIKTQGKEGGLRKRNVQRFLKLMSYLKPEKIIGAMDLFNRELYYTKTLSMLKQPEADTLRDQWNRIYYKAKAKCAK